jgi:hypothetical protein
MENYIWLLVVAGGALALKPQEPSSSLGPYYQPSLWSLRWEKRKKLAR